MPDLPSVSVVIPTYNRADRLERILRPLLEDPSAGEVIVVVDGSTDGSLELVQRLGERDPRLRGLFIENRGDMGARAAGAAAAQGEIVLFIDDDVLAGPRLVSGHARRHAERAPDVVVGYMPIETPSKRTADDFAERLYAREYEGRCMIYERDPQSALRELWGGNFSMRRADCLAVGMSNPGFTEPYHADRDFGIRCLEARLRGVFDRSLAATHLHRRSLAGFVRDARSQGAARVLMPSFHAAVVGPPAADEFERNLPAPVSHLVRLTRRPRAYAAISAGLTLLVRAAGQAGVWTLQDQAARVLRRVEQQHGAIEQSRGRRPS